MSVGDKPGRESPEGRILFDAVGMGIQDLIVADRVYRTAKAEGRGRTLSLWDRPLWL